MSDRILVIGAGAIGAFYAGVLARAGCEVSAVVRSDFDTVAATGYRIESHLGDLSWRPAQVLRLSADFRGSADFPLVCLKLTAHTDPVELIRPALGRNTAIVFVANGIDIESPIAAAFPEHELISGVAYAAVSREAPGVVRPCRTTFRAWGRTTSPACRWRPRCCSATRSASRARSASRRRGSGRCTRC